MGATSRQNPSGKRSVRMASACPWPNPAQDRRHVVEREPHHLLQHPLDRRLGRFDGGCHQLGNAGSNLVISRQPSSMPFGRGGVPKLPEVSTFNRLSARFIRRALANSPFSR